MSIRLRKFPYPYQAALTIASDTDGYSTTFFEELHKYLNTKNQTKFGAGLGLEIGDSFWMFTENDQDKGISYFTDSSCKEKYSADLIQRYYQKGILDILHTYGDFSFNPKFDRELATKALKELENKQIYVDVWVNHGSEHNFQNLINGYGDLEVYIDGSKREFKVKEYHVDMLVKYGIRFVWIDKLTMVVGQERRYSIGEYLKRLIKIKRYYLLKNIRSNSDENTWKNELMRPLKLRDGQKVYEFIRYGDNHKSALENIPQILNKKVIKKLIKSGGITILYTHLGKKSFNDDSISEEIKQVFRNLKDAYEKGDLLITTTSKILNYLVVSKGLKWNTYGKNIVIEEIDDPVKGKFVPSPDDLRGITFYVSSPKEAELYINQKKLEDIRLNPPDLSGRKSISIKWK